ncbi:hypothetical protein J437_LFUL006716 [Ladona fulva]|uniref:Signal recognition particle subunit SRP68 n=1 Tax=Ladona fulva TaxID=123851 RepID=A0A8K0NTY4_LADFU|nr:hypothetical protein J437_LFUL006716 [Ladona fulva]
MVEEDVEAVNQENVDEIENVEEPPPQKFTFEILKIIKEAQQQHGLRHGDYQRYRGYCTRRIRRLRKVLRITQGDKRHFKKKEITEAMVKDEKKILGDICDARAKLEVEAYSAWIHGALHFELQMWKPAIEDLKKAQYANLLTQTLEKRATVMEEVEWRGRKVAVRPERVRLFLMSERELGEALARSPPGDNAQRISLLETHLMECKDAVQAVREELKATDPNFKGRQVQGGPVSSMHYFLSYLMHIRLTRTIQRNLLMAETVKQALSGEKAETGVTEGRRTRPQDLTRLYEIILQNLGELQSLAGLEEDMQYQQDIEAKLMAFKAFRYFKVNAPFLVLLNKEIQGITIQYDSGCFYIAFSLTGIRKWREAWLLYNRSQEYTEKALAMGKQLGWDADKYDKSQVSTGAEIIGGHMLAAELKKLSSEIEGQKFAAHAHSVLGEDEDGGPGTVTTAKSPSTQKTRKPLMERLHEYVEDPALATTPDALYRLPPDFRPVPCKPLFFDLAFNFVEFPELDDKLESKKQATSSAGLTGFVKGLWGWGGSGGKK